MQRGNTLEPSRCIVNFAEGIVQFVSRQRLGLLLLFCHHPMKPCIRGDRAVSNTPMPRARAAALLFLGGSSGHQPKLLRRNVLPLAHPTAKARARSARYRLLCANREFCGERCAPPRLLQSRAIQEDPSPRIKMPEKCGGDTTPHLLAISYATRPVAAIPRTTKAISRFF